MAQVELPDELLAQVAAAPGPGEPAARVAELVRQGLAAAAPSLRDPLTQALTGAALSARLQEALRRAGPGPYRQRFLCLDLDDFQRFADSQGQPRADAVLRQLVKDLHALYGREAVYRLGGDDLVVVLGERSAWRPGTPPGVVLKTAEVVASLRPHPRRANHLLGWLELHVRRGLLVAKPEGTTLDCKDPPGLPPP